MKILINTSTTLKGGGLQVAKSFIEECKLIEGNEYEVILGLNIAKTIDKNKFPSNFNFHEIDYRPGTRIFSLKPRTNFLYEIENKVNPDVVFTTSGPAYWRPKSPHLVGFNLPHYVYKDSPFFTIIPYWKKIRWNIRGLIKKYFLRLEADAYVVQTEDVNLRLKKWIKREKIFTVSNSCSSHYFKSQNFPRKITKRTDDEFLLLLLSAYHPHKNFEIIKKIIDLADFKTNSKIKFVLTLPQNIFDQLFENKYHPYIYNLGSVPVSECASLYKECDAMFLPTLLECFSASYVEAMFMEKPILTSNLGFAKTVCEDSALYFDPLNEKDILEKINILILDKNLQKKLVSNGIERRLIFNSANQRALNYLKICKNLIS
jgi:glycosyltransferase involved in cell wall biosynthesis